MLHFAFFISIFPLIVLFLFVPPTLWSVNKGLYINIWTCPLLYPGHADLESVTVTLVRGPGSVGNVSADLTTSDLTARRGIDYFTAPQPVMIWFPDSVVSAAVNISLANDGRVHPAKQFTLYLTNATGLDTVSLVYHYEEYKDIY